MNAKHSMNSSCHCNECGTPQESISRFGNNKLATNNNAQISSSLQPSTHQSTRHLPTYKGHNNSLVCVSCDLFKGAIASSTAKFCIYPLDRLKMIYQVKGPKLGLFTLRQLSPKIQQVYYEEGCRALWKGYSTTFIRSFIYGGISFRSFLLYQQHLPDLLPTSSNAVRNVLSGGLAGITATFFTYPLDVWNTRLAVSRYAKSYSQVTLVSYGGIRSLYHGFAATCYGIFPYAGCAFLTYEYLKETTLIRTKRDTLSPIQALVCGGCSGVLSQTLTYPFDTLRKFLQANIFLFKMKEEGYLGKSNPSFLEATRHIYRNCGVNGFLNGLSLNWIKGFAGAGISFMIHESLKIWHSANCL